MAYFQTKNVEGVGACIALPFLEAMSLPGVGKSSSLSKSPIRSAFFYMPNGVHPDLWTPAQVGRNFEFTRQLMPLQNLKNEILVLVN
jgi:hypothetical protein